MIVLVYLRSEFTKFHVAGGHVDFLHSFIWSRVSGLMRFRNGSDSKCAYNFVQISERVRRRLGQGLDKHSGKKL
jgi:hypothetical protein